MVVRDFYTSGLKTYGGIVVWVFASHAINRGFDLSSSEDYAN